MEVPAPVVLTAPALFDSGVWTWVRDRRFRHLREWFNQTAARHRVLVCDLTVLELTRLAPNLERARARHETLSAFPSVPMPEGVWRRAREIQLAMAADGDHRRVPPTDLLIAAAAEAAGVPVVHYDRDYERIAAVSKLEQRWFVPAGSLAA